MAPRSGAHERPRAFKARRRIALLGVSGAGSRVAVLPTTRDPLADNDYELPREHEKGLRHRRLLNAQRTWMRRACSESAHGHQQPGLEIDIGGRQAVAVRDHLPHE